MKLLNKKAQVFDVARKSIYWMIAGVVITVVVMTYIIILTSFTNNLTKVPDEVQGELLVLRFINNPSCFAYRDADTDQIVLNSISMEKFNEEQLTNCYETNPDKGFKDMNFKFVLGENEVKTNNFFHKIDFTLHKSVLVWDGSKWSSQQLTILVQEKI